MTNRFAFLAGETGMWRIRSMATVVGHGLEPAGALSCVPVGEATATVAAGAMWRLDGLVSNVRYATRDEIGVLRERQADLGRLHARHAALLPIRKSARWWGLAQDERRAIFEETSHHTAVGLEYLPAIARKLFHARDIGEPFDFLTWFEFAPEHEAAFDDLLARLRATAEWAYVEREVDIRLERI